MGYDLIYLPLSYLESGRKEIDEDSGTNINAIVHINIVIPITEILGKLWFIENKVRIGAIIEPSCAKAYIEPAPID